MWAVELERRSTRPPRLTWAPVSGSSASENHVVTDQLVRVRGKWRVFRCRLKFLYFLNKLSWRERS
jgi:hypothetical protein